MKRYPVLEILDWIADDWRRFFVGILFFVSFLISSIGLVVALELTRRDIMTAEPAATISTPATENDGIDAYGGGLCGPDYGEGVLLDPSEHGGYSPLYPEGFNDPDQGTLLEDVDSGRTE